MKKVWSKDLLMLPSFVSRLNALIKEDDVCFCSGGGGGVTRVVVMMAIPV